jgi:hypothetical protein
MKPRLIAYSLLGLLLAPALAIAQQQYPPPGNYQPPTGQNVQSGQPDRPQLPTLERRGGQPGVPPSRVQPTLPFPPLTPQ